jgi:hypothetical protein
MGKQKKSVGGKQIEAPENQGNGERVTAAQSPERVGWYAHALITAGEAQFRNNIGRDVTVRAEVRLPEASNYMRVSVGRVDARSPIGLSRNFFYEDIPYVIEALLQAYAQGKEYYIALEGRRIQEYVDGELCHVERIVSEDTAPWKDRLREIRKNIMEQIPG